MSEGTWSEEKITGLVGEKEIDILATYVDGDNSNAQAILFRFKGNDSIFALRWSVGAIMELGTEDLAVAKGSVNTMIQMEASDKLQDNGAGASSNG